MGSLACYVDEEGDAVLTWTWDDLDTSATVELRGGGEDGLSHPAQLVGQLRRPRDLTSYPDPVTGPGEPSAPAGWYPDPDGAPGMVRWWNGLGWSDVTTPAGPGVAVQSAPVAVGTAPAPPVTYAAGRCAPRRAAAAGPAGGSGWPRSRWCSSSCSRCSSGRGGGGQPRARVHRRRRPRRRPGRPSRPARCGSSTTRPASPTPTSATAGSSTTSTRCRRRPRRPGSTSSPRSRCPRRRLHRPVHLRAARAGVRLRRPGQPRPRPSSRSSTARGSTTTRRPTSRRSCATRRSPSTAHRPTSSSSSSRWDVQGYEATGERAALLLVDVGRAQPALLYLSIPNTHAELYGVIDQVIASVDVL